MRLFVPDVLSFGLLNMAAGLLNMAAPALATGLANTLPAKATAGRAGECEGARKGAADSHTSPNLSLSEARPSCRCSAARCKQTPIHCDNGVALTATFLFACFFFFVRLGER
jgi:hypothetical protein